MFVLHRLAILSVVLVCGAMVFAVVDRNPPPIVQPAPPVESPSESVVLRHGEHLKSFNASIVLTEVPTNIREIELSRRAQRPANQKRKTSGRTYDEVLAGSKNDDGTLPYPKSAEPMPPTSCRSVEPAPKSVDSNSGPHKVHDLAVYEFGHRSGFGFWRMFTFPNKRGINVASQAIDRVELVSLLTEDEPSVYVLDEMATPPLARQAKRRPLDEFERLGLDAVRRGEHLVWAPEAPKRMFGAIRARTQCLECHVNAKRGDLLGAFTYYLDTPVNELAKP